MQLGRGAAACSRHAGTTRCVHRRRSGCMQRHEARRVRRRRRGCSACRRHAGGRKGCNGMQVGRRAVPAAGKGGAAACRWGALFPAPAKQVQRHAGGMQSGGMQVGRDVSSHLAGEFGGLFCFRASKRQEQMHNSGSRKAPAPPKLPKNNQPILVDFFAIFGITSAHSVKSCRRLCLVISVSDI